MTLTQTYESARDLLTGIAYHRGSSLVVQRDYVYDALGRPTARNTSRQGSVMNDTFTHNTRSELAAATVNGEDYAYLYDNIGNRVSAVEGEDSSVYTANALNQYTVIRENTDDVFTPEFDADGNQTRVKTSTGIWALSYDTENRPTEFTSSSSDGTTTIQCAYDTMGRRAFKKVTTNGTVTLHQRFIYRGYLQIACCDLTRTNHPCLWLITCESPRGLGGGLDKPRSEFAPQGRAGNGVPASQPTQPVATRPLALQKDGTWYTYGLDLTKNVCEVFGSTGYISTAYTYTPFGKVTATGNVDQPIQWSSEFCDNELGLVYYNYRHYNPQSGRWLSRDIYAMFKLYVINGNNNVGAIDYIGLKAIYVETGVRVENFVIPGAEEDIACSGLTSVFIKRKYELEKDKTNMKCQCVERIAEWTILVYILAENSYELQGIGGKLYLSDDEKKSDIMSKLKNKPKGVSKAEYLMNLELTVNSKRRKIIGDTYIGNKYHESIHKKQLLRHKKEIQKIMDSYKRVIYVSKNATQQKIEDECKSRKPDSDWELPEDYGIKFDILAQKHKEYEREAIKKTYEFYIKKYGL